MNTHTKQGRLTAYGFACGYVESKIIAGPYFGYWDEQDKVELYQEGSVYHVKRYSKGARQAWETFESLAPARKFYDSFKRQPAICLQ